MPDPAPGLVLVLEVEHEALVAALGAAPWAAVQRVGLESLRRLPPAAGLVVGCCTHARVARATGFPAPIVVLAHPADDDEHAALRAQGTSFADPSAAPADLAASICAALSLGAEGPPEPASAEVTRIRRLIAAGEIACTLQHALNNPLTALMTEVQLLQLDAPNGETRAAAGRMLELVRRVIDTSRSLDGVRDRPFTR